MKKLVNEALGDLLKPKDRKNIDAELNKYNINNKMLNIRQHFTDEQFLIELEQSGADTRKIINLAVAAATKEQLVDMILDLIDSETRPLEFIATYMDNLEPIIDLYVKDEDKVELNNIANNIIVRNTSIFSDVKDTIADTDDEYYPYPDEDDDH